MIVFCLCAELRLWEWIALRLLEDMACGAVRTWTFTKLIGAFLDLAIAFMMLCGSTMAYFASKFLGVLGLNLPCPCNGLFGNPNEAHCVQRFLVEYPASRISSVHSSVRRKFPYDLIYGTEQNCQAKMNKCISFDDRPLELEGAASCSSVSDGRKPCGSTGLELVPKDAATNRVARFDLKRKGIAYQRSKSGLRRRRKVASEYGTMSSAASYDPCGYDLQETPKSSFNFHDQINGENAAETDFIITQKPTEGNDPKFAENYWHDEVPQINCLDISLSNRIDIDGLEEIGRIDKEERVFTVENGNDVNVLEQALKEEKAARAALYIELEKERNAAASAADEAMGMILRLQKEKASIEMQARQYQRMIEEKSAYDAEEMNLLKEILLRREREKYVLEKEVENYKQAILGGEQSGKGIRELQEEYGLNETLALDSDEDPLIMLQQISESIMKRESNERASESNSDIAPTEFVINSSSVRLVNHDAEGERTLHDGEINQDKVVSVDKELPNGTAESQHNEHHIEKQENDEVGNLHGESECSKHDQDTDIVDVHVVGNELSTTELISDKSNIATSSQKHMSGEDFTIPSNTYSNEQSCKSNLDGQHETKRLSDITITSRSPPMVSKVNFIHKEEGNSLSEIDLERLKIENEVESLRHKLKTVQEGRGNLNFFVAENEGVKRQLQLLDDIANQLKEMQICKSS